jgi:flagellar basal body P-ring formation protein FlgA
MRDGRHCVTSCMLRLAVAADVCLALVAAAAAQSPVAPAPKAVIYPGDVIRDDMLADMPMRVQGSGGPFFASRSDIVGKSARTTLLPGQAIPLSALVNRRLVANGAEVRLVYAEGGLTIVTAGAAMQDGGLGDQIRVRNSDSGVTVTGAIQPDGSVRVGGL